MLLEGARAHSAQTKEDTVRVVVLGAATPLGQQVVEDLAFRGHRPTAVLATAPEGEARWQHLVAVAVGHVAGGEEPGEPGAPTPRPATWCRP